MMPQGCSLRSGACVGRCVLPADALLGGGRRGDGILREASPLGPTRLGSSVTGGIRTGGAPASLCPLGSSPPPLSSGEEKIPFFPVGKGRQQQLPDGSGGSVSAFLVEAPVGILFPLPSRATRKSH